MATITDVPTITTSEGLAKMAENDAALTDAIIKAHCSAEAARAGYWATNGTDDAKIFYIPAYGFWKSLAGTTARVNYDTFIKYKRMWDDLANSEFKDTPVLELIVFLPH